MRKITASLIGAAAIALSLFALRQPRPASPAGSLGEGTSPSGERVPGEISLDRIRAQGL